LKAKKFSSCTKTAIGNLVAAANCAKTRLNMLCSRQTTDPLLTAFLKDFQINLLGVPRKNLDVGRLFVRPEGDTLFDCAIDDVFNESAPEFVDEDLHRQAVPNIEAKYSNKLNTKLGLSIVDRLYRVFGVSVEARLESAYKNASAVRIRLRGVTQDEANLGKLATYLGGASIRPEQTLFAEGNTLFVVVGVFRAESIEIEATDSSGEKVDVSAEVAGLVKARPEVQASTAAGTLIAYKGQVPLVIGVRLLEIKWQDGGPRLNTVRNVQKVCGYVASPQDFRQIGNDAFIDVSSRGSC
jgi:hypothetical protein